MSRFTSILVMLLILLGGASSHAEQSVEQDLKDAERTASTSEVIGEILRNPGIKQIGEGLNHAVDALKLLNQTAESIRSGNGNDAATAAGRLASSGVSIIVGGVTANGVRVSLLAATSMVLSLSSPLGIAIRAASIVVAIAAGDSVKNMTKEAFDDLVEKLYGKPEPQAFQGSQDGKRLSQEDMMKDARSIFQTFADAKGDLPGHRDAAYKKIEEMNRKPKGLDYDSEPHTLKYGNGAQVLGDQRGQPQGPVDFSQKGSMLPNRVAEPMVQGADRAGTSGNGATANTGGNGSNAVATANGPATNNAAMPGGADAADNAAASTVRAVMTAVRKRNIQDKIKNAPSNRPPGFEQAVAQLLKMAESGPALQQDDALEARIRAGDANAIQFFEFAKGYASGKGSLKEFEAMNKRLNPSR